MMTISFDASALVSQLKGTQAEIRDKIGQLLDYAGRQAVSRQRDVQAPQSYTDQSGNLRSSVGFMVMSGGQEVSTGGFEPKHGANPKDDSLTPEQAAEVGKGMAKAEASLQPSYPTLTVVAGMHYASYVEAKGRDVLSTAKIVAEDIVKQGLEDMAR